MAPRSFLVRIVGTHDETLLRPVLAAALAMVSALALASGPIGRAEPLPTIQDAESKVAEALHAGGVKSERPRDVVWFDPSELSRGDGDRLADAISNGMANIENMLGLSFDSTQRLEFFVTSEFGVTAFTTRSPRRVFLPLQRVRERRPLTFTRRFTTLSTSARLRSAKTRTCG